MVDSVTAPWHGGNYQARIFWQNAFNLLMNQSGVVEVTFEADGPKAFDDLVVKYDPPIPRSGPDRVSADYHQIKWHNDSAGRFGYEDLISPEFIGASSVSLLQRLQQARVTAPASAHFSFMTTYRIKDGDPLARLVSANDHTLLLERLFDAKKDRRAMGKVRKLWREHLGLGSDDELKAVVRGLRIFEGYLSLEELRTNINCRAQAVGVLTSNATDSDFRLDELARQLKVRKLNVFTRESFQQLCRDENLLAPSQPVPDSFLPIAIRSFLGPAADIVGAAPDNTLLLTDEFRQRYLHDDRDWQRDVRPKVEAFLGDTVRKSGQLRLILDAHASIALLAGTVLDAKSGTTVHLVQKGRVGARAWRADDGTADGAPLFDIAAESLGSGREIALAISASQGTRAHAAAYISEHLPTVGQLVSFTLPGGPNQQSIAGGAHASILADQIANHIREIKGADMDILVHIFAAVPNSLLFYLGQQHRAIAPCVVYEFDFDRQGNKSYQPSFEIT